MNGNFEVDRGSYPYNGQRVGESLKLYHVPTQKRLLNVHLPGILAAAVALRLNTAYYAALPERRLFPELEEVRRITLEELGFAYERGNLDGTHAQQLKTLVNEAGA